MYCWRFGMLFSIFPMEVEYKTQESFFSNSKRISAIHSQHTTWEHTNETSMGSQDCQVVSIACISLQHCAPTHVVVNMCDVIIKSQCLFQKESYHKIFGFDMHSLVQLLQKTSRSLTSSRYSTTYTLESHTMYQLKQMG